MVIQIKCCNSTRRLGDLKFGGPLRVLLFHPIQRKNCTTLCGKQMRKEIGGCTGSRILRVRSRSSSSKSIASHKVYQVIPSDKVVICPQFAPPACVVEKKNSQESKYTFWPRLHIETVCSSLHCRAVCEESGWNSRQVEVALIFCHMSSW